MGTQERETRDNLSVVSGNLEKMGLATHEECVSVDVAKALETKLELVGCGATLSSNRVWKIKQAVKWALSRRRLPGKAWEIILGHLTFCSLLDRSALSCLRTIYAFVRKNYETPVRLWSHARDEVLHLTNLLPYLFAQWRRPWCTWVLCTDASESGFGVVAGQWNLESVKKIGRVQERGRFRRREGRSAREDLFEASGYHLTPEGVWELGEAGVREDWEVVTDFPEIDGRLIADCHWTTLLAGPWRFFSMNQLWCWKPGRFASGSSVLCRG